MFNSSELHKPNIDELANNGDLFGLIYALSYASSDNTETISIRIKAVQALGELGDQQAIEPLLRALSDDQNTTGIDFTNPEQSPCVASEIINTLALLNAIQAIPTIIKYFDRNNGINNEFIRIEAAHALGVLKNKDCVYRLMQSVKDPLETDGVHSAAIWAIGELGDKSVLPFFSELYGYLDRLQPAVYTALIKLNQSKTT